MSNAIKPVMNIADAPSKTIGNGKNFVADISMMAPLIGSTGIGCMVTTVPPGKAAFPFHVHHVTEELFFILEGTGTYRFGKESYAIKAGDVLAAPAGQGAELAHQIINTSDKPLKYLGISNKVTTDVVEYPDSGKFAATSRFDWSKPQAGGVLYVGRKENSLDYFEGE